jgi:hypothetical protein
MEHLHIDVVPAVVDENNPAWLRIPDVKDRQWIATAPKVHSAIATDLNGKMDGLFKPLVRLLKGWNAGLPETARFKSFAVETLAGRLFGSCRPSSLTQGVTLFLDFASWRGGNGAHFNWTDSCGVDLGGWSGSMPDLAGTGSNLVAGYDSDRRAKFTMAARVARDAFLSAATARTSDTAWSYVGPRLMAGMERL